MTLTRLSETQKQQPQSFVETRLGRLPAELRTQVYHGLVATPPTYAGQELNTRGLSAGAPAQNKAATPATVFVHLKASTLTDLKTCRQIYKEAQPIFYARTSYYAANGKELEQLVILNVRYSLYSPVRPSTITSLCVKDLVSYTTAGRGMSNSTWSDAVFEGWENLPKIYLCMRVSEEIR